MADGDEVSGRSEKCQPCSRKGRKNVGVKFCDTCQMYFCSACLGQHDDLFDHQQVHGAGSGESVGGSTATDDCTELCVDHILPITLYCNEEDKFGCTTCMDIDHKSCKQLIYLPANARALLMDTDFRHLNELLRQTRQKLESIKPKQQSYLSSLVGDNEQCIQEVTDYYTRLLETLSAVFKSTIEMIQQTFESMHADAEKNIQNVEECLTGLEASRCQLHQFKDNTTQLFIEVRKCQNQLKKAEAVSAEACDNLRIKGMGLVLDRRLENLLTELQTLAKTVRRKTFEVKKKYIAHVSANGDSSVCDVTSTCIVKDGYILAVDYANVRVKHLDGQTLKVLDTCSMQTAPIGICCIDDNEAVVTCSENQIVLISINPKLLIIRTLLLNHRCGYVAYYDGELFITDVGKTLYVHSLQGTLRRKITIQSGTDLFSMARHVIMNDTGDKVFVADRDNGIVVINRKGVVVDKFDNRKLTCSGTRGACLDDVGGVFVCDRIASKVAYLDHKGQVVDILTSADGLTCPRSVCFDRKHRRLIVSQEDNNDMIVLEML